MARGPVLFRETMELAARPVPLENGVCHMGCMMSSRLMAASIAAILAMQSAAPATFALAGERPGGASRGVVPIVVESAGEGLDGADVEAAKPSGETAEPDASDAADVPTAQPSQDSAAVDGVPSDDAGDAGTTDATQPEPAQPDGSQPDGTQPGDDSTGDFVQPDAPQSQPGPAPDASQPDATLPGDDSAGDSAGPTQPGADSAQPAEPIADAPDTAADAAGSMQAELEKPVPGADGPVSPTNASTRADASIYSFLTQEQIDNAFVALSSRDGARASDVSFASLLAYADQYCGLPYVWGGKDPNVSGGFDCSGFVAWVFNNVAGLGIDSYNTNAAMLYTDWCTPISREEARPGDLVFFKGTYGGADYISHVGIYCGNGIMVDAGDPIGYDAIDLVKAEAGGTAPAVFGRLNGITVTLPDSEGWREEGGATYYYENGQPVTGERAIYDGWYYFDPARGGAMATGITTITMANGVQKTVYYDERGRMVHGEANIDGGWYYFSDFDGTMARGITTITMASGATKTVCYGNDGRMRYGEQNVDGGWYYFDTFNGTMATGLTEITMASGARKTVLYGADGRMRYGEAAINGGWYYFDTFDGHMVTGFKDIPAGPGTKTVLYDSDGRMRYGEVSVNGSWYYLDEFDGHMVRGWKWLADASKLVYYDAEGRMVHGSCVIGGLTCQFDTFNGALVSPGLSISDALALANANLTYVAHEVPYVDQNAEGAPMGCEGAALYMALRGQGALADVSFKDFLNDMPRTFDGDPNHGFVGNPWVDEESTGIYQSIYPAPLAAWGAKYGEVRDITGTSTLGLAQQLVAGKNIVAYVSLDFQPVRWKTYSFGAAIENAHVIAIVGFDPGTARFLVADPNSKGGTQWVDWDVFDASYASRTFAVAVG